MEAVIVVFAKTVFLALICWLLFYPHPKFDAGCACDCASARADTSIAVESTTVIRPDGVVGVTCAFAVLNVMWCNMHVADAVN